MELGRNVLLQRCCVLGLLGAVSGSAWAQVPKEVVSSAADREALAITVYNDDLALVRERRKVTLPEGPARLSLREVSARLRPETANLRDAAGHGLTVLEQNFDFDLLTPSTLLEKFVGRTVQVVRSHPTTGEDKRETATVLSANGGTVLKFADRVETGAPGRVIFDSVPVTLRDRPTLSVLLEAKAGPQSLELSYLSAGLSWKADYVANLSPDNTKVDLSGWVTLTNKSGTTFDNARLQLVAGTVNRVRPPGVVAMPLMVAPSPVPRKMEVAQENLLDFHLYSFDRPTSIADNQTKQVALLSASGVSVRKEYLLTGADWYYRDRTGQIGQKLKPEIYLEFQNKGAQMGKPLPAGVVRVYARDSKGAAQFVGEDRVEHTAANEAVRLRLGEAFDITAERRQTNFRRVADGVFETSYRIDLRNARDEASVVKLVEPLPGEWEVTSESVKHTRESARIATWEVSVPAGGKAALEYTVRVNLTAGRN